ncbi:MAG: sulfatase [Phycisphaerae bacterium]|jgi:N-sulfoglucosamine sulfohydrolase
MTRWWRMPAGLLALAGGVFGAPQRNILMVVTDDQGLDAGCYGNPVLKTPHLDRLAAEGVRFTQAFCTTASCSASRSVILTGLHNHANGQYGLQHAHHNFHTLRSVRSLPVLLREAGYRTCSVGKFHVQPEEVYHFDAYARDAEAFLRARDDRPFFLYFCTSEPHRTGRGFGEGGPVRYDPQQVPVPPFLPDRPEVREELAGYYQAISRADAKLGRLLAVLKDAGHWDDTLVIFLSDNGMPFPGAKTTVYEPGIHLPLVVRSPEQKRRGGVCNAMVTWADLTPTLLAYAGAQPPAYPLHGRSFLEVLDQSDPPGWDEIHASHTFHEITMYYPMRAIRTRRYKYILNLAHGLPYPFASDLYGSLTWQGILRRKDTMMGGRAVQAFLHRPRHELYDLETDPQERVNLADRPEHAKTLAELQARLRAWQEKTRDPWVVKYTHE